MMSHKFCLIVVLFACMLFAGCTSNKKSSLSPDSSAYATKYGVEGNVVAEGDNEWFIIQTSKQYVVIEAQGIDNFKANDKVYGDFYGFNGRDIFNVTKRKEYKAWVEAYFNTYDDAMDYMKSKD